MQDSTWENPIDMLAQARRQRVARANEMLEKSRDLQTKVTCVVNT